MCARCFHPVYHVPLIPILIFWEQRTNYSEGELLSNRNVIARKKEDNWVAWDKRLVSLSHAGYRNHESLLINRILILTVVFLISEKQNASGISCIFIILLHTHEWVWKARMSLAHVNIKPHQEMDTAVGKRRGSTNSVFCFLWEENKGKHLQDSTAFTGFSTFTPTLRITTKQRRKQPVSVSRQTHMDHPLP